MMAELCGILLALMSMYGKADRFGSVCFACSIEDIVPRVFQGDVGIEPGQPFGPAIMACRSAVQQLQRRGVCVSGRWVPREHVSEAYLVARAEMRERRCWNWRRPELWLQPVTDVLQGIFAQTEHESGYRGRHLLPPYITEELERTFRWMSVS